MLMKMVSYKPLQSIVAKPTCRPDTFPFIPVEVFKTSVCKADEADSIIQTLQGLFPVRANFDLDDRDHILRVEFIDHKICTYEVMAVLQGLKYHIEILID